MVAHAYNIILALEKQRQENQDFKAIISYTSSSGPAWISRTLSEKQTDKTDPMGTTEESSSFAFRKCLSRL